MRILRLAVLCLFAAFAPAANAATAYVGSTPIDMLDFGTVAPGQTAFRTIQATFNASGNFGFLFPSIETPFGVDKPQSACIGIGQAQVIYCAIITITFTPTDNQPAAGFLVGAFGPDGLTLLVVGNDPEGIYTPQSVPLPTALPLMASGLLAFGVSSSWSRVRRWSWRAAPKERKSWSR